MNFLTFRDQIYEWTLDTDENLFSQVNQLTDYIFQTQQNITQSIAITRHALNDSSTILNNNFNHYLRLSENKFTENKIAEPKKSIDENAKKQDAPTEPKSKMDIFKQALNISLKNLQIKEEEKQADNVSISELSLSQAIFKNARLPPYFGSKQFRAQKFLNLFFDEDMGSQILSKKEIESMSNKPLSTPSQDISSTSLGSSNANVSSGYLPPPPSLESLNLANNVSQPMSGTLPPPPIPPPLNLLPPPPLPPGLLPPPPLGLPNLPAPPTLPSLPSLPSLPQARQSVVIDDQDENKQLLESILVSTRSMNNNSDSSESSGQPQFQEPPALPQPPKPVENKPLTFQQELALKLKLGKDYKPPARVIQTSKPEPKEEPKRQPEPSFERANSFRQSTKIQDIIGVTQKPTIKQTNSAVFDDEEEQQENALFGSGKRKTTSQTQTQSSKFGMSKNQADAMMSRSTFNEDMLFKKKPIFSKETVMPTKTQQKPKQKQQKKPNRASVLFNQDSDEEQDFTFKKKTTKKAEQKKPEQQAPKKKPEQKKSNPLGLAQKSQVKEKPAQQPKKKNINKLFGGDSDQEGDIFAKKKPSKKQTQTTTKPAEPQAPKIVQKPAEKVPQKPSNPLTQPKTQKKNSLFNDDEQEEDFAFKPKAKQPVKKESKKQEKKSSLFGDDEDDDSVFKPKPKPVKKQVEPEPIQQEVPKPKPQSPQKSKGPLFSSIPQEENEEGSGIFLPKKPDQPEPQPIQKTEQPSEPVQEQESEEVKRMKKIARMGGQPMMGMAQMIPKGMNITKPSETKQNQKIARQHIEQEKQKKTHSEEVAEVQPKRQLDPLEKLITQTIKAQQPIVKKEKVEPKRELDPLEKLIGLTIAKKSQQNPIFETETKPIPKPEPVKVEQQQPKAQSNNAPEVNLEVRRKKNKPKRNDDDFDDDQKEKQVKKPVVQIKPKVQVKQLNEEGQEKVSPVKQVKKNPLTFSQPQQNSQKASQLDKIAKMSMAGMPQMGMGPLMMPKGLIITKPSQAKKLQQQALERMKQQEEERAKRQQQEQKERERQRQVQEQQELRKAQQQQQLRLQNLANQKLRQQQEQRQRKQRQTRQQQQRQQQRLLYQQQQRQQAAYQQALRQQEAYEQSLRQQQQLQRQKQLQAQQLQRRRIEQENQRLRKAQQEQLKKQKSSLPSLTAFEPVPKKQSNPLGGKVKQSEPLDVPKMPPKVNPLGGTSTKSPLGGPLGGPLGAPKSTGLFSSNSGSVPPMPAINRDPPKNTGKKSLFDDDDDQGFSKKKQTNLPKQSLASNNDKKKPSLFGDDDDDSGFGFGSKAKPKKNTTSKKGLFDDDDDQGFGFGKKTKKPQPKQPVIQPPIVQTKPEPKPIAQKSALLNNDSDDDDGMFGKKKPQAKEPIKPTLVPQKAQEEIKPPQPTIAQKSNNKKRLFGGSDSDSDEGFGKKKATKQPVQAPTPTTNNLVQNQPKPVVNAQKEVKSKKGLFGSSDDEEQARKPTKPTVMKETPPPVASKPAQGKKTLFGGSDDDEDDDVFKRKAQKKPEPVKSNPMQNEPLIPSKKAQSLSTSPLTTAKTSNPLGLSSGLTQPKPTPPSTQPAQQKKRNIFQQSDQQPSPIKSKPTQPPPAQQKRKLIQQDSQDQKPPQQAQKPTITKQPQPQPQPPVPSNNNRRLFDDSEDDSDAEEMAKKKRMANNKIKKLF